MEVFGDYTAIDLFLNFDTLIYSCFRWSGSFQLEAPTNRELRCESGTAKSRCNRVLVRQAAH